MTAAPEIAYSSLGGGVVAGFVARAESAAAIGGDQIAWAEQVHGSDVAAVTSKDAGVWVPDVDALVTREPGLALAVRSADCLPVLLADPSAGVVAAAHAGRRGLLAGVLQNTVATMRGLGATEIRAVIGPAIGPCCYELPPAMVDEIAIALPAARGTTRAGTPAMDLRAGAVSVLTHAGVTSIDHVGGCTADQPARWLSYRRNGTTARLAGIVVRRD